MTGNKTGTGSDWVKADAYVNTVSDYEELPEITDEQFAGAVLHVGGEPVAGCQSISEPSKQRITLRLDPEVIDAFKATGAGWQGRMNDALAAAAKRL